MTTEGGTRGRVGADCQAEALRQTGYRQPTERDLNPRFRGFSPAPYQLDYRPLTRRTARRMVTVHE